MACTCASNFAFKGFKMMFVILLFSTCVTLINARCPDPSELPRKYDSSRFMCARLYEHSHKVENWSCGGSYLDVYNGETTSHVPHGWNDRISSLVVSEGCRLDVYWDGPFKGKSRRFTGKATHLRDTDWNDVISSWACSCDFSNAALTCTPSEEYMQIVACGNPGQGSANCVHSMQNGLAIGNSVTQGRRISDTVQITLGAVFMEIFSVGLATSTTTEFSWSRTDSSTISKVTTTTISCDIPPGSTVKILQAVGRCGDTVVYTNHYLCKNVK